MNELRSTSRPWLRLFLLLSVLSVPEVARAEGMAASVELHGGFFGLFNLNRTYTDADPAFGATAAFEVDVHPYFALGGEYGLAWIKSARGRGHRLTMGPQLRARFNVALGDGFTFFVVVAAGFAIWPEHESEPELHPALADTRVGWSLRVNGGCEYAFDAHWSVMLAFGYAATSSYGDGLDATVDNMTVNLGARFRF